MVERRLASVLEFRDDALGQNLAELNAPLVERINVPEQALVEDGMLVKRDQLAKYFRRKLVSQNRVRWPVAFEDPVWHQPVRRAFRLHLFRRFAEGKRLGLGENIGQQDIVMRLQLLEILGKSNEVARNAPGPLLDLIGDRELPAGSALSPGDGTGIVGA